MECKIKFVRLIRKIGVSHKWTPKTVS